MRWLMPADLMPRAGLSALVVAWPRISPPTAAARLFVDELLIGMGTSAAWAAAWAVCWWIEQRW